MRLKFFFALAVVCGFSSTLRAQQTTKITPSGIGYLEYLPQDYSKNSNDYPIVIFLHGIGERGSTSTDPTTLKNSVQKVANVGLAKYIKYGSQYPFIVISPQLKTSYGTWPANYVMDVLNHVKKYLRVNDRRIYITGLSLGGFGTWTTLAAYPDVFAAAVPICSGGSALSKACAIASANIPLWGFHATDDRVVSYTVTTKMINAVNACTPKPSPLAKTTLFPGGGHIIWDKVYKQTDAINWMTSFTKGSTSGGTTSNSTPTVNAGSDRSITLPTNEIYLQGTASDSDGSIASYQWTKVSGGVASLANHTTSKLRAYNLVEGSYTFRLTATDDKGATKSDDVIVKVLKSSTANIAPVANAGPDKTTSNSSITINGSGTDKDGKIVSYKWTQYYGAPATLTNASSPAVTVSGLKDGKYFLKLTVTDDSGASAEDNMQIVVSNVATSQPVANIAPVANAGPDRTTSSSAITINGSGTDKDGKIVSYKWTQYGGATTNLSNVNTPNLTVSGLKSGKYYYRLTVTDDKGASHFDNMLVVVGQTSTASNVAPISNAGFDKRITTDISSLKVSGSGYDKDGEIVSYKWTQYGGSDLTLRNATAPILTVTGLDEGKYYLQLTVKDNDGKVDHDRMMIVVNES